MYFVGAVKKAWYSLHRRGLGQQMPQDELVPYCFDGFIIGSAFGTLESTLYSLAS